MAAAGPPPTSTELEMDSTSRQMADDYYTDDNDGGLDGTNHSMRDKERKIGHRRVDKSGIVSYKKKPTSELMAAIQLGIGQSVGGLSSKPERDVLMQDFGVVEVVFFPGEGSNLTPAHHYSDFRFKTYAPVAFRYFRDLFGIQPEDFMLSLCNEPLKELSNPGASGSIFYLTNDDEFIIKTVQHKEAEFLQKLLPGYFLNISQNKRTLLPKFYGLYCYQCGGKNIRFTVMNNLLPSTVELHEKYDMKGSTYKRKASKSERAKKTPTMKDLDFLEIHPECLQLEKDIHDSLYKTLQRDCRVLESFKIMDYSLLVGIYNLDLVSKERTMHRIYTTPLDDTGMIENYLRHAAIAAKSNCNVLASPSNLQENEVVIEHVSRTHSNSVGLQRAKSIRTRIGQYSTPLESIQGNTDLTDDTEDDEDVPPGGIPARNAKGERILLYLGIIDILQSFRLKKRLEHTVKSMVIDGDTISVHRPSYYAQRFLQYHATRVFKKVPTALKHSPSKRRALNKSTVGKSTQNEDQQHSTSHVNPRSSRTISFSDEQTISDESVGHPPDLLPQYSKPTNRMGYNHNNGNSSQQKRSDAFTLSTYPSEDALSAGTASTASLRAVGVGGGHQSSSMGSMGGVGGHRGGPSPPLSLSESTPTHTDFTEGTPSFTNSSPSCSSDVMDMGGLSPLDAMEGPTASTSSSRSPDLHHHRRVKHGGGRSPLSGTGTAGNAAATITQQQYPYHHHHTSPSKQQTSDITVTVIPESPPPPFEAVVKGDQMTPPTHKQQQHTTTTTIDASSDSATAITSYNTSSSSSSSTTVKTVISTTTQSTQETTSSAATTYDNDDDDDDDDSRPISKSSAVPAILNTARETRMMTTREVTATGGAAAATTVTSFSSSTTSSSPPPPSLPPSSSSTVQVEGDATTVAAEAADEDETTRL